jgi:predicted outer membrane protein
MKSTLRGFAWLAASTLTVGAVAQDQPAQNAQQLQQRQLQQQPAQQVDPNRRGINQQGDAAHRQSLESHIANCIMLGNQEEIVLLTMGQEKTENSDLKQAAAKMIQDHQQFIQQLQPHASIQATELNQWLSPDSSRSEQNQPGQTQPGQAQRDQATNTQRPAGEQSATNTLPGQRRGTAAQVVSNPGQAGGQTDGLTKQLLELEKKVAKECIRMNQEALKDKEGAEFDKAFVGAQVAAHMSMLAKLKASEEAVSGELQQLLKKGQETTKQHKEKLVSMMKDLKDDSDSK